MQIFVKICTQNEEARQRCGAHLVFKNILADLQLLCAPDADARCGDGMHTIDLGIILKFIRAILRTFMEIVEIVLDIQGRAAKKLEMRFLNVVARRTGRDGQRYMYNMHTYAHICIYM